MPVVRVVQAFIYFLRICRIYVSRFRNDSLFSIDFTCLALLVEDYALFPGWLNHIVES